MATKNRKEARDRIHLPIRVSLRGDFRVRVENNTKKAVHVAMARMAALRTGMVTAQ